MLTIFSCPKSFRGHINIIQRNAIKSWTLLQPRPEIILIGDEEGTAEVCKEFDLRHICQGAMGSAKRFLVADMCPISQNLFLATVKDQLIITCSMECLR